MKILLADDHPLFREGVKPVLLKLDRKVTLIEADDYPSAFAAMHKAREVDLALLDLYMPGMSGLEGVIRFRAAFPDIPVVVLSAAEQAEDIRKLLEAGALGYVTKSSPSDVILTALQRVLAGGIYVPPSLLEHPAAEPPAEPKNNYSTALTARQIEVLRELAKGLSNRQIGDSLQVTEGTVKLHVAAIFRLLMVNNRTEAVLVAQKMGLHKK
ncbi:MAG: response regulator transcription factor [Pseudomonadota bacterium]|nr:response regulator transcription factor [Pseudomonadota bacterium]